MLPRVCSKLYNPSQKLRATQGIRYAPAIFAENRIQEARDKKPHLPQDLKLHLVGAMLKLTRQNIFLVFLALCTPFPI